MKKNIDKLEKRQKREIILLLIVVILISALYIGIKILLLSINRYYLEKFSNYSNYNVLSDIKYEDNKKLAFIDCSDCKYYDVGQFQLADKIKNYELKEQKESLDEVSNSWRYEYIDVNDENKYLKININDRNLSKTKKFYYDGSNIKTISGLNNTDTLYYERYKYIIYHYKDNLKGNIFDMNGTIEEKNDILYLEQFMPQGIQAITIYDYDTIKEMIEFNMKKTIHDDNEFATKIYYFKYKEKEYWVEIYEYGDISNEPYINYLKLN